MIREEIAAIEVEELSVTYRKGKQATRAVEELSFSVSRGETVGFVGPNGAGKSTTIKAMMGFVYPDGGEVRLFGEPAGSVSSKKRIGYLPEVALYYPFMKGREILELYGGLHGLSRQELRRRIPPLLERVGLSGKSEILLREYSKGMQQRIGIAQALIAEPELLIFDEMSSGLDPLGRYDLRELLFELKSRGTTIFFSSHELSEVESLCDRVIIIHQGRKITENRVDELLKPLQSFHVVFTFNNGTIHREALEELGAVEREDRQYRLECCDGGAYVNALRRLIELDAVILSSGAARNSLEEFFVSLVRPEVS